MYIISISKKKSYTEDVLDTLYKKYFLVNNLIYSYIIYKLVFYIMPKIVHVFKLQMVLKIIYYYLIFTI